MIHRPYIFVMKWHVIAVLLPVFLCFHSIAGEAPEPQAKPVAFDVHDGYFVSNQFEADAPLSFAVIRDQEAFDRVFGAAVVMRDKSHRLPDSAFDKKWVVTAIRRGKAMVKYKVESLAIEDRSLVLRYSAKSTPSASASFSCPLIVALERCDFSEVRFVENGKTVKVLDVSPANGAAAGNGEQDFSAKTPADGKMVITIRGKGIGRATLKCQPDRPLREVLLRAHLRGLESLVIANGRVQWKASVLSHSGHPTLLHLSRAGKDGPQLTKEDPFWVEIRRLGPDGKPVDGLPPEGGCFEIRIPEDLFKDAAELKFEWIDFHRG
jgi:hypothetical protein